MTSEPIARASPGGREVGWEDAMWQSTGWGVRRWATRPDCHQLGEEAWPQYFICKKRGLD